MKQVIYEIPCKEDTLYFVLDSVAEGLSVAGYISFSDTLTIKEDLLYHVRVGWDGAVHLNSVRTDNTLNMCMDKGYLYTGEIEELVGIATVIKRVQYDYFGED